MNGVILRLIPAWSGRRRWATFAAVVMSGVALGVPATALAATTTPTGGYDVVMLAGQSNMTGYDTGPVNAAEAAPDPRIEMWDNTTNTIVEASNPLIQDDTNHNVGPGLSFAKAYLKTLPANRNILLVGTAVGSTGFNNGWLAPDGNPSTNSVLSTQAVAQTNAAMAAAGPGSTFDGILWDQGENDIIAGSAYSSTYQTHLISLINYFRSNIAGASSTTPVVVTEMTYQWMYDNLVGNTAGGGNTAWIGPQLQVLTALHTLPDVLNNTAWTSSGVLPSDAQNGDIHFSALSNQEMGLRDADRFYEAKAGLPQPESQLAAYNGSYLDIGRSYQAGTPVNLFPTVNGSVSQVVDPVRGTTIQISNAAGFVSVNVPATTFNASYTKYTWFKPGASGYYDNLISANNPGQSHYLLARNIDGTLLLAAGHSDGNSVPVMVSYQVTPPANTWINVAVSYNATIETMTLYYNGRPVSTATGIPPAPALQGNPIPLDYGSWGSTSSGGSVAGVDGAIEDSRVYTSALTAGQIAGLYNYDLNYRAGF